MRRVWAVAGGLVLAGALTPARAAPAPWDGTEPAFLTHHVDRDGDGTCDGQIEGTIPNGVYPACSLGDFTQVSHGHFEYTHEQQNPHHQGADTEEKDYAPYEITDPSTFPGGAEQTYRMVLNEPARFGRALSGPRWYWQVDEWIGPTVNGQPAPGLTWNERFFFCADPCPGNLRGGYWSDQQGGTSCYNPNATRKSTCGAQGP